MGELPPGVDIDNLDELLAALPPALLEAAGIDSSAGQGQRGPFSACRRFDCSRERVPRCRTASYTPCSQ